MRQTQDYPAREGYCSPEKAAKYARRSPSRNRAEERLLSRLLARIKGEAGAAGAWRALDVPSGAGRMAIFLQKQGFQSFEADFSPEMLSQSRRNGSTSGRAVVADLHGLLPYQDASFDLVLCWRFLHHLPGLEDVKSIMSELARVTRRWVIVSFFHPLSVHNLQRKVRTLLGGDSGCRYPHKPGKVKEAARAGGMELKWTAAQLPYLKDLWAAAFIKQEKG